MPEKYGKSLIEKGIWIKEQNGVITMGTLQLKNEEQVVLPRKLADTILALESEMIEALYGKAAAPFHPDKIDIKLLLDKVIQRFNAEDLRITAHCTDDSIFSGNWNELFDVISSLVRHSIEFELKDVSHKSIHMNASVVDGNFCFIYRDSGKMKFMNKLQETFEYIQNVLNGDLKIISGSGKSSYLDILIPGVES